MMVKITEEVDKMASKISDLGNATTDEHILNEIRACIKSIAMTSVDYFDGELLDVSLEMIKSMCKWLHVAEDTMPSKRAAI